MHILVAPEVKDTEKDVLIDMSLNISTATLLSQLGFPPHFFGDFRVVMRSVFREEGRKPEETETSRGWIGGKRVIS